MGGLQWYILKVGSKQEEKIKANLLAALEKHGLMESVSQVLVPCEKVYEIRNGRKQLKNRNLFSGYILLYADLSNEFIIPVLRGVAGVWGFLGIKGWGFTNPAVPLSQAEVDRIIGSKRDAEGVDLKLNTVFMVGESVKIIDGPFSGFTGQVQEIYEDKKTLSVLVKIFDDRITPLELSYTQIKKAL